MNRALSSLKGGSLEITLAVPLNVKTADLIFPVFVGPDLAPGKAFNSAVIKTILIRNLDFQHFKNSLINTEKSLKDLIFFLNAHRLNITKSKNHYCKHSLKLEKKHNSVAEFG